MFSIYESRVDLVCDGPSLVRQLGEDAIPSFEEELLARDLADGGDRVSSLLHLTVFLWEIMDFLLHNPD